jgi:hypothetical protein
MPYISNMALSHGKECNMSTNTKEAKMDKFIIRFDGKQREAIKLRAEKNRRSMNAELLALIDAGISVTGATTDTG